MKPFKDLTEAQINKLKKAGLLYALYPEARPEDDKPKMLENPDINSIKQFVEEYINDLHEDNRTKDTETYLYETVMIAFYGEDIFKWLNTKRTDY